MNLLITGGTGYLGKNLVRKLLESSEFNIALLVRKASIIPKEFNHKCTIFFVEDEDLKLNIKQFKPKVVIHLASFLTSSSDKTVIDKLITANINFGTHLLDCLKETNVEVFINTGTFAEYHFNDGTLNPTYLYSATKTAFRAILQYYSAVINFRLIDVVPYTIYGNQEDNQKKIIDILFDSINAKSPLKLSKGLQKLDFIHVNDVVDFYVTIINSYNALEKKEEFALGTGIGTSIRTLASLIETETGKRLNVEWGGSPERERDTVHATASIAKNILLLNWIPKISIEQGIKMQIASKNIGE